MTRTFDAFSLAVDGGGTRCRIALVGGEMPLVAGAGSVNVSTDFAGATAELLRGFQDLAMQAGGTLDDLSPVPAYIGLAGVTGPELAERLAEGLPLVHVRIEDDRLAALRGALGRSDGVVAHCGTGSFVASRRAGQVRLAGGWGPVLGDEASAQWVGRQALARTLDAVDGFLVETELSRGLLSKFGSAAEIVAFAGAASPADLGALAVMVTDNAAAGDGIAVAILQNAAEDVVTACKRLGWTSGMPICLTGGIGPFYRPYLPADMQQDVMPPKGEPLAGAIALAEEFRKEIHS
ncbi:MAG: ATPase [Rhodobacteraceae bacterium]|nr:ATPase [Paracoccaceae bacterium]